MPRATFIYVFVFMDSNCTDSCLQPSSVVGVPSAEDWPQEVALPQSAFTPRPPKPIENFVPDMDEQGRALLMVPKDPNL